LRKASTGFSRAARHAGNRPASVEITTEHATINPTSPGAVCAGS
jgi:hypothetical protein